MMLHLPRVAGPIEPPEDRGAAGPAEADDEAELDRLDWQAHLLCPAEDQVMIELGLPWAGRALEVGCGTGAVAERLMRLRPGLEITGLDREPIDRSARARRAHQRLGGRYHHGDATAGPYPGAGYDLTYARLLLRHVPAPGRVVGRLRDAARPGGRVILIDADDGALVLAPEVEGFAEAVARVHQRSPCPTPAIGRHLVGLARAAGLAQVEARVITLSTAELSPRGFFELLRPFRTPALNGLGAGESRELEEALRRWAARDDAFAMWSMVCVGGTAPPRGAQR